MKGFKLNSDGDVVIEKNEIAMASDTEMIIQTVRQVLRTNIGEWIFDTEEGIDFHVLLSKKPDYDLIRDTVQLGLRQVNKTFNITRFDCKSVDRRLYINFTAETSDGTEISISL